MSVEALSDPAMDAYFAGVKRGRALLLKGCSVDGDVLWGRNPLIWDK